MYRKRLFTDENVDLASTCERNYVLWQSELLGISRMTQHLPWINAVDQIYYKKQQAINENEQLHSSNFEDYTLEAFDYLPEDIDSIEEKWGTHQFSFAMAVTRRLHEDFNIHNVSDIEAFTKKICFEEFDIIESWIPTLSQVLKDNGLLERFQDAVVIDFLACTYSQNNMIPYKSKKDMILDIYQDALATRIKKTKEEYENGGKWTIEDEKSITNEFYIQKHRDFYYAIEQNKHLQYLTLAYDDIQNAISPLDITFFRNYIQKFKHLQNLTLLECKNEKNENDRDIIRVTNNWIAVWENASVLERYHLEQHFMTESFVKIAFIEDNKVRLSIANCLYDIPFSFVRITLANAIDKILTMHPDSKKLQIFESVLEEIVMLKYNLFFLTKTMDQCIQLKISNEFNWNALFCTEECEESKLVKLMTDFGDKYIQKFAISELKDNLNFATFSMLLRVHTEYSKEKIYSNLERHRELSEKVLRQYNYGNPNKVNVKLYKK